MEFIHQLVELDDYDESLVTDDVGQEKEEEVRRQFDDDFIDDENDFQDQDAQTYRLANVSRDFQGALQDQSMSQELGVCSNPENYTPDCFGETE